MNASKNSVCVSWPKGHKISYTIVLCDLNGKKW